MKRKNIFLLVLVLAVAFAFLYQPIKNRSEKPSAEIEETESAETEIHSTYDRLMNDESFLDAMEESGIDPEEEIIVPNVGFFEIQE